MANCNIIGEIPEWLCRLSELRQLDLQRNYFTGRLPGNISELDNLLYLNVKDNVGITGEIPVDSLAKMSKLNRLSLVHCSFVNISDAAALLQEKLPRCRVWV